MTWPTTTGRAQTGTFQNKVDGQLVFNAQSSITLSRILTKSNIRRNFFMNSSGKKERKKSCLKLFSNLKLYRRLIRNRSLNTTVQLWEWKMDKSSVQLRKWRFTRQLYNLRNGKMHKTTVQHEKWKDGQDHCTTLEMKRWTRQLYSWEMERWTRQLYNLRHGKMDKTTVQLEK